MGIVYKNHTDMFCSVFFASKNSEKLEIWFPCLPVPSLSIWQAQTTAAHLGRCEKSLQFPLVEE